MKSPTKRMKEQAAAGPVGPVGPLRLAAPARSLTHSRRLVRSDAPMRIRRGVSARPIQSRSRCLSTSGGMTELAAAT